MAARLEASSSVFATSYADTNLQSSHRICMTGGTAARLCSFELPTPLRALNHTLGSTLARLIAMNSVRWVWRESTHAVTSWPVLRLIELTHPLNTIVPIALMTSASK